jgi:hypothetical protein
MLLVCACVGTKDVFLQDTSFLERDGGYYKALQAETEWSVRYSFPPPLPPTSRTGILTWTIRIDTLIGGNEYCCLSTAESGYPEILIRESAGRLYLFSDSTKL